MEWIVYSWVNKHSGKVITMGMVNNQKARLRRGIMSAPLTGEGGKP